MFGYSPEQWREDSFFTRILHPDDRERVLAERKAALANGSRRRLIRVPDRECGRQPALGAGRGRRGHRRAGRAEHFEGFLIDVSESVRHQRELEAVSRISEALVAQSDVDALIDLAGGLLEDTFASDLTYVALFDSEAELISFPFFSEGGSRLSRPTLPLGDGPDIGGAASTRARAAPRRGRFRPDRRAPRR